MKKYFLLIVFSSAISMSYAQEEKEYQTDKELKRCLDSSEHETTMSMATCFRKAREKWEKEIDSTYQWLIDHLSNKKKEKLEEAQKAWLSYSKKELAAISEIYFKKPGTENIVVTADEVMQLYRQRAIILLRYKKQTEENFSE